MPLFEMPYGSLRYGILDRVAPCNADRGTILFHHDIGGCPGKWPGWQAVTIDRNRIVMWGLCAYGRSMPIGFP